MTETRMARDLPLGAEVTYHRVTYTKTGVKRWVSDDGIARFTDALIDVMLGDGAVVAVPVGQESQR